MLWLRDLLCDLISYYIQQYSTKSINCIYLSSYFWYLTFLIHQILFIYYWEVFYPSSYLLELISQLFPLFLLYNYWVVGYTSFLQIQTLDNQKSLVIKRTAC